MCVQVQILCYCAQVIIFFYSFNFSGISTYTCSTVQIPVFLLMMTFNSISIYCTPNTQIFVLSAPYIRESMLITFVFKRYKFLNSLNIYYYHSTYCLKWN